MDPVRLGQLQIQSDADQLVEGKILEDQKQRKQSDKRGNFRIADGQNISVEEHLHIACGLRIAADHGKSRGNHRGKENSDDGVRRKSAPLFDRHDAQSHQQRQKRHGQVRTDGTEKPEGHPRKCRVPDRIRKEGHPEIHHLGSRHGRHGRDQNQSQQSLLHEAHLHALQRNDFPDQFTEERDESEFHLL